MQSFPYDSLLTTLAEVSAAVVGFSLLASVLRGRTGSELRRFITFRDVAEIGMIAAFGSLAPQVFSAFGWDQAASWRLATGSFGVLYVAGFVGSLKRRKKSVGTLLPTALGIQQGASIACILASLALIATNVLFPSVHSGARHILAVVLTLAVAGLLFLRAAFDEDLDPPAV